MSTDRPTIFALSSGRGPAAIAVVRISGPRAREALKILSGKIPEPRKAALARIRDPASNEVIDEALALWFPAPHSETGEDVAELQLHGGRAVIAAVLGALRGIEGFKPAEAGEFTRRAFENGKLDLTAVEGLADLVMAETEGQRRQAFRQMKGALGGRAEAWRAQLIKALALIEAAIDFSDEADVPKDLIQPALAIVRALEAEIAAALQDGGRGERLREGFVVAIAGPPNAGKSTLLNRIAKREAAIVSPFAGTTRDVIEVHLDLDGWPVTLLDTAGIRATGDPVEMEGVRRARERAAGAELVLWVVDAVEIDAAMAGFIPPAGILATPKGASMESLMPAGEPGYRALWLVRNKIDQLPGKHKNESTILGGNNNEPRLRTNETLTNMVTKGLKQKNESPSAKSELEFNLSALSGEGFEPFLAALARQAELSLGGAEPALVTRERHRYALECTLAALRRALSAEVTAKEDLLAEELRSACAALGRLTGRIDVEDILDVIFRDFCIGK
jgi:tRNA modification GTPase